MPAFIPRNILLMPNQALSVAVDLARQFELFLKNADCPCTLFPCEFTHQLYLPEGGPFDLLIVFGGDGSLLRAGHLCAPLGIPLLGVQAGRLGFLVEVKQEDWQNSLHRLLQGDFRLEKRMMLSADFLQGEQLTQTWDVINELVLCRGAVVHPIEIRVDLNEGYLSSYHADGLIVATATGSTAYALASGGPILPPELRNMLLLPIAPHLSLDRAVILAEGAEVYLRAVSPNDAVLSVDGLPAVPVTKNDRVRLRVNPFSLTMLRFGEPNYFYRALSDVLYKNPILGKYEHD